MAERRMFSNQITDSDAFLDLPATSQLLYFHLGMKADDEGFINNPKKIMRYIGSGQSDLELLFDRKFLLFFDSGVVVVKHWKVNNQIRKDRMKTTAYQAEKHLLLEKTTGAYKFKEVIIDNNLSNYNSIPDNKLNKRLQSDNQMTTKCPHSIGEYRLVEGNYNSCNSPKKSDAPKQPKKVNYTDEFNQFWECYPKSRRVGKAKAFLSWKKMKPPIEKCLETLAIFKASKQWTEKGGQFIPHPTTWLNRGGWEDETENIVDVSNPWKGEMNFEL